MSIQLLEIYRKKAATEAAKEQAAYEERRKKQAQEEYAAEVAAIDAQAAADKAKYKAEFKEKDSGFRERYDENAVNELIARRQVAETVANLGLSRSGTAVAGEKAASVTREKADSGVDRDRQAAVEELDRLIRQVDAAALADKGKAKDDAKRSAFKDMEANRKKVNQQAEKTAQYNYKTAMGTSISEKRTEYAMLLIRHDYSATEAWAEAYRLYPPQKEGTV